MTIQTSQNGPVLTVAICRPERRNAIDFPTAQALAAAFRAFDSNESLAVAVLTGAGGYFCAGADLKALASNDAAVSLSTENDAPLGVSRIQLSKPVIAAVEGPAVAGGQELALWCDLRVAAEDAVFGVFCRRWGVPLVDGGTVRLPRLIGHSHALDMILTGRPVSGAEAKQMGLANRLVATGSALTEAQSLAAQLSRMPQTCMRNDRLSSYEQWGRSLEDALANETRRGQDTLARTDVAAGAARFAQGHGRHGSQVDI